ncbi:TPA: pilus assembly protein CpaB [Clostridioides difficile]|nr:pilus assembly protein CpaB [Clostridioides difficile]
MDSIKMLFRNKKFIGLLSLIIGCSIAFISPTYQKIKSQTTFVRVSKTIKRGEKINDSQVREINTSDSKSLPSSSLKQKRDVVGKYAIVDMEKDDLVLKSKVSMQPVAENEYLYGLNGEKRAISITIKDFASGLSGKLQTGDIISIIATDFGDDKKTIEPPELKYVRVLAVTNAKGADKENDVIKGDENENENDLPTTITVMANEEQTKLLAKLEVESKMHISLIYRGTDYYAEKFIEEQDKAIKSLTTKTLDVNTSKTEE